MARKPGTPEQKLFRSFIQFAFLVLVLCIAITLSVDITRERKNLDSRISDTAAYLASLDSVQRMLMTGYPDAGTIGQIDTLVESSSGVESVVIENANHLRFYQTDRAAVGDMYMDGDEEEILSGAGPYIKTVYGTRGRLHCAFHAVRNGAGAIIGFTAVSVPVAMLTVQQRSIILIYVTIFVFMLLLSALYASAFLRFQQNALMGYRPDELLKLYIRQDEVVNSLSEGLISADRTGKILFSNKAAREMVSESGEYLAGRPLGEVFPGTLFGEAALLEKSVPKSELMTGDRSLIAESVPVRGADGKPEGVLVILQDRTDALRMSDELSGARNMMDTLRAFNHEFLNKLHIILGYLQTGEIEKAKQFITNSSLVSSQAVRAAADAIRVSEVCALVIGKMMHAAELGIKLSLQRDSSMRESALLIRADEYVTVIGNLLENSIEELNAGDCEVKEIGLGIYCGADVSVITCEDTGGGIRPEVLPRIFEKGVTSKGENHGTGLFLVKQITDRYGGDILIETEAGEGTCFTVTFTAEGIRAALAGGVPAEAGNNGNAPEQGADGGNAPEQAADGGNAPEHAADGGSAPGKEGPGEETK